MKNLKRFLDKNIFWLVFLLSLPAIWALFVPGFYGASDEVHIAWLYEIYETIKLGQIPPRFVPDLSFGHGYPLFNFVFPLPYYIGSVFHYLGFSLVDSVKLVFFLSIPLSAIYMYKLLRLFSDQLSSLLGAIIYIYSPYRSTDIYVRGAIGEILAFTFLPLIVLSLIHLNKQIKVKFLRAKWIGVGAVAIALLILSHNIVSYMFLPFVLVLALMLLFGLGWSNKIAKTVFITGLLGIVASSYFWIPAIFESSLMQYSTVFNYWDHFPTLRQLITPYFGYGASVPGPGDGMSFFVGFANLLLFILTLGVFLFKRKKMDLSDKTILGWSLFLVLFSVFMMNHRSAFIWKSVPLLPYFQFPWRFLTMITFSTPLMVISLKYLNFNGLFGIIMIILVIISFPFFRPQDFLGRTDDYFLAKYIPFPKVNPEYLTHQEEYLRLPRTVTEKPPLMPALYTFQKGGLVGIENVTEGRLGLEATVITDSDLNVSYSKYFFPGWIVTDNGRKIKSFTSPPYGDVTFLLEGKGVHQIKVYFKETPFRFILNLISLSALVLSLLLIYRPQVLSRKRLFDYV